MRSRELVSTDGNLRVEVQRGDGEVVAYLEVWPSDPDEGGLLEYFQVEVGVRDETEPRGPANRKWARHAPAFSVGTEHATLLARTRPEKVT